jgi:hypothetical protein
LWQLAERFDAIDDVRSVVMSKLDRNALTENEIAARWDVFGPSPVLSSENKEGYNKLRNAFVRYFRPTDIRHWSWIRELVDTQWEIHRHLGNRTAMIEQYDPSCRESRPKKLIQRLQQGKDKVCELPPKAREWDFLWDQVTRLQIQIATIERGLHELTQPNDSKDRLAYENAAKHIEKADKWLKNATARRNSLLKILEYYCRPIDRNIEIRAANYTELKQSEVKQIATSPACPRGGSLITDLTTEDRAEIVAAE